MRWILIFHRWHLVFQECKPQILNHVILKYGNVFMSYSDVQKSFKMEKKTAPEFGDVLDSNRWNFIKRNLAEVNNALYNIFYV